LADQAKEMDKAKQAAEKFQLEMEKLASNERIKAMEFTAKIDVAEIEAQTKRVEAAFQSINNTINSTGETLVALVDTFAKSAGMLSFSELRVITDQIEAERRLREQSFELQKELTRAQIDAIKAQTRAIEGGDALIKIDGAGLQPQLEAFMWEILRTIQVRVNQQGLKLLLGV
jgi:hypothetical protein